jgi:Transcriptional regulator of heat shock gene
MPQDSPLSLGRDDRLLALLDTVIEHYIFRGDPIGSKFLHSLEDVEYAPSTLRKYLNLLEREGMLAQLYNSSGRIPTVKGLSFYLEKFLEVDEAEDWEDLEIDAARRDVKFLVEQLAKFVDGVTVGFVQHDQYSFLGINNLLKNLEGVDYAATREIVDFIESKEILPLLSRKKLVDGKIYYTFVEKNGIVIPILYCRVPLGNFDAVVSVVGSVRMQYKRNISILKKLVEQFS